MESKHTKTDWIVESGKTLNITAGKNGFVIAEVTNAGWTNFIGNENEALANAKLIASAPELLEALTDLLASYKLYVKKPNESEYVIKAEAAINKALN